MAENLYTPHSIRTVSGRYVNLLEPNPNMFSISDIAWALSGIPRFGGHLPREWSVAQHCLCCMAAAPEEFRLEALMHDASEAYLLDVPSPLKEMLKDYPHIEGLFMALLAKRYGFTWPLPPQVKQVDRQQLEEDWNTMMLGTEPIPSFGPRDRLLTMTRKEVADKFELSFFIESREREQRLIDRRSIDNPYMNIPAP